MRYLCENDHMIVSSRRLAVCPARAQTIRNSEIVAEGAPCGADLAYELIDLLRTPVDQTRAGGSEPADPPRSTGGRSYCSKCSSIEGHWSGCERAGLPPDRDHRGVPVG